VRARYCDTKLSFEERAADLVGRLTIEEKVNTLAGNEPPHYCGALTTAVPRLGLPAWRWLTEANSNAAGCVKDAATGLTRCSTVFVGPAGIAASFNRTSWWHKGDVISDQVRVHNNLGPGAQASTPSAAVGAAMGASGPGQGGGSTVALSAFGPNINTVKDPRYGRNSELPGECPFLAGTYADAYTQGMQQVSNTTGFYKMLSYLKHYTAYNKEASTRAAHRKARAGVFVLGLLPVASPHARPVWAPCVHTCAGEAYTKNRTGRHLNFYSWKRLSGPPQASRVPWPEAFQMC